VALVLLSLKEEIAQLGVIEFYSTYWR